MDNIIQNLKKKIKRVREDVQKLVSKKQTEIARLNKVDQNYKYLDQILDYNLPMTPESNSFFVTVGNTANSISPMLGAQFQHVMDDEAFYSIAVSTAASGVSAALSYPSFSIFIPDQLKKKIYAELTEEHEYKITKVKGFLHKISPHLTDTYDAVYQNINLVTQDPERSILALMREIVNQVLSLLSPDFEIQKQSWYKPESSSKTGITRKHRVRYIAENKAKDRSCTEIITSNIDLFDKVVNAMNKFHKRGKLNLEEAKALLYQAENLLEILCDSINL